MSDAESISMKCRRNSMKKLAIMVIALAMLVTGFAMADPGMNQTPETQGWSSTTTANVYGNIASSASLTWEMSGNDDVRSIDLADAGERAYVVTYSEDTYSNGIGDIRYDKALEIETMAVHDGAWNVYATKQIAFAGVDGARIYSDDDNMIDGAGTGFANADAPVLCPFFPEAGTDVGAFCNTVKMGSSIDMTFADVRTTLEGDRFIIPKTDDMVEKNYEISVTPFTFADGTSIPSIGSASAYMDVLVRESRDINGNLHEQVRYSESTDVDGEITAFEKIMHYESSFAR
jgi:hypothetical protein